MPWGLFSSLPVEDEKILENLKTFQETIEALEELYGVIPVGPTAGMFKLHDESVAESIKLINGLKKYAKRQEENAKTVFYQAPKCKPQRGLPYGRSDELTDSPCHLPVD